MLHEDRHGLVVGDHVMHAQHQRRFASGRHQKLGTQRRRRERIERRLQRLVVVHEWDLEAVRRQDDLREGGV
eukprot:scaffold99892_cov87-Phaeocystis_antarctica.AAC.1